MRSTAQSVPCSHFLTIGPKSAPVPSGSASLGQPQVGECQHDAGERDRHDHHDREHRRRYDTALGQLSRETEPTQGCWFRFGANQPMRNVALARTLIRQSDVDDATVALCAPSVHKEIWRRWAEAKKLLPVAGVFLADLPVETVVGSHENGRKLSDRYLLDLATKPG